MQKEASSAREPHTHVNLIRLVPFPKAQDDAATLPSVVPMPQRFENTIALYICSAKKLYPFTADIIMNNE